ncbi:hypothetical protein C1645_840794 [Glomus cerebriforme]|uniref:F-box domain-containing protein n=1 Tax=Glomus cerebriforme TaxID=658196 RepID=A0A397RYT0_9GLOM|nr:hypothetical protein C1645_840794 [Glomus cerebriforme]
MLQLPTDCINDILEYLVDERNTLYSCLLVNKLWCEISVRILWRNIRNYNTLMTCLPSESKEILSKNGIVISTLTSKPPMFNYASFCKSLSIYLIYYNMRLLLKQQSIPSQNLDDKIYLVSQEILKFLMSQIPSLKRLEILYVPLKQNTIFTSYPGAKDCLNDLSELYCHSYVYPEFFYQLAQICHNIHTLNIRFKKVISNGLTDLISAQKNLKYLNIHQYKECEDLTDIITSLTKIPNTLRNLKINGGYHYMKLSFITKFTNLQELTLLFRNINSFEDFKILQYFTFSKLQILKFRYECPRNELLINFLENNGNNLREFYISKSNDSLNSAIIKFCPNIKKLSAGITNNELESLKMFFNGCQYLESIQIQICEGYLSEKDIFEVIAKYSPQYFYELKLNYSYRVKSELLPEELESFFVNWSNRIPQKPLSLIFVDSIDTFSFRRNSENKKIIDKYINMGFFILIFNIS